MQASLKAVCAIMDMLPESQMSNKALKQKLEDSLEDFYETLSSSKYKSVFTHGDLWTNSAAFKYEDNVPKTCKLLNFQFVRYAPPAFDVTEWICNASGDFSKKCYYELLDHYYSHLRLQLRSFGIDVKNGIDVKKVLPLDEFENSCKIALRFAKIMKAFYFTVSGASDEFFDNISQNPQEFNKFYYEDRAVYALDLYNREPGYREGIRQLVENLVEDLKNDVLKIEDLYYIVQRELYQNSQTDLYQKIFTRKILWSGHGILYSKVLLIEAPLRDRL